MVPFNPIDPAIVLIVAPVVWVLVQAVKAAWKVNGAATVKVAACIGLVIGAAGIAFQPAVTVQVVITGVCSGVFGGLAAVGIDVASRAALNKPV